MVKTRKSSEKPIKPAATVVSTETKVAGDIPNASMRKWNGVLALLFALQGIIILVFATSKSFPVFKNFLAKDPLQTAVQGKLVLTAATHHVGDINMVYLVAAFLFVAAIAHGLITFNYRTRYEAGLRLGRNKLRWIEYALSGGLMVVAIGLLAGVQDVALLVALFGLVILTNWCGSTMEARNTAGQTVDWRDFIISCVAGILPWIVIALYLLGGVLYGATASSAVWWIFGTIFVLTAGTLVATYLHYRKIGRWADYIYTERTYTVLSFLAKSVLAWQLFASVLKP